MLYARSRVLKLPLGIYYEALVSGNTIQLHNSRFVSCHCSQIISPGAPPSMLMCVCLCVCTCTHTHTYTRTMLKCHCAPILPLSRSQPQWQSKAWVQSLARPFLSLLSEANVLISMGLGKGRLMTGGSLTGWSWVVCEWIKLPNAWLPCTRHSERPWRLRKTDRKMLEAWVLTSVLVCC